MKLRALRVRNVGPFGEAGCALEGLSDGLNVIRERNEAGKSTLFKALQFVLFEKHSSRKAVIEEFRHDRGAGAPFIELDLDMGGRNYRISKQYLSSATAVVTDALTGERLTEKRDAENWIAELIGGDKPDEGPLGMLWIRQGDPFNQPKPGGSTGEALFSVLEGEVDTVMGGQRAARVLERAQNRLDEIVSSKQMSPKGAFKEATMRLADLEKERTDLADAVRQSESDRQKLVAVIDEQGSLKAEDDDQLGQDLADARKEREAAEGASENIRRLKSEAQALMTNLEAAENSLGRYDSDSARAGALQESITELEAEALEYREDLSAKEPTLKIFREEADQAAAALKAARETHREALARDKRRQDFQRRSLVENALVRARDTLFKLAKAKADASIDLPDLSAIEKANQDVLKLEADAQAIRPTLTILRADAPVRVNEEVAAPTAPVRLSGRTTIGYKDLELTIETPDAQGAEQKLAHAKRALRDLLEPYGATDIGTMRRLHEKRNIARDTVNQLKDELAAVAPDGVSALENTLAALHAANDDEGEPADLDALARQLEFVEVALAKREADRDAALEAFRSQQQKLTVIEVKVEHCVQQLAEFDVTLGRVNERKARRSTLEAAAADARRRWREAQDRVDEAERDRPSLDAAKARVKRLEAAMKNRSDDRLRLSRLEGELRGRLAQAGQDGAADRLAAVEEETIRWQEQISAFENERDALALLIDGLSEARAKRRSKFFAPVRQAVDPLLSMVLGNASLGYDDHLGPDGLERNGALEKIDRLSGGTREQIAVLTRLGFAQVMASKGMHMPVVLDDALVYSDDDRIERLFDAINVVAHDVQIIAFSCRQKTFASLGGNTVYPKELYSVPK